MSGIVQESLAAAVLAVCLFWSELALHTGSLAGELEAALRDTQTQWMITLCIVYAAVFLEFRNGLAATARRVSVDSIDIWRVGFLLFSAAHYFLSYGKASHSRQAVTVLGCALLGSGVWVGVFWGREPRRNERALRRLLIVLVVLLGMGSFWGSGAGARFAYKDHERWHGPWDNSNLCGLLMASGVTLVTGLGVQGMRRGKSHFSSPAFPRTWRRLGGSLVPMASTLAAGAAMAIGVLRSYSRGAWVAAVAGGVYLLVESVRRRRTETQNTRRLTHLCGSAPALVVAAGVLLFWNCRHGQSLALRRVVSVVNWDDLSWRDRVASWEGDWQMMAERPWLGFGWSQPQEYYGQYYSASWLEETAAIQMNDYLTLGTTLGLLALFCFCTYLWLVFTRSRPRIEDSLTQHGPRGDTESVQQEHCPTSELAWLKLVCRAGALVLVVGFWFYGGLFELPTAATFWILLELGRERKMEC